MRHYSKEEIAELPDDARNHLEAELKRLLEELTPTDPQVQEIVIMLDVIARIKVAKVRRSSPSP